jgi:hypothetical protein
MFPKLATFQRFVIFKNNKAIIGFISLKKFFRQYF